MNDIILPSPTSMPRQTLRVTRRSGSYQFCNLMLLLFLLIALDTSNFLGGQGFAQASAARYLVLLIPIGAILATRTISPSSLIRRTTLPDRLLLFLLISGLAGSLYGKLVLGTQSSALPIFAAMSIGVLSVFVSEPLTEAEARRVMRGLAALTFVYIALHALASSGKLSFLADSANYRHSKSGIIAMGIVSALYCRKYVRLLLALALSAYIFSSYPAGTYVVVAIVSVLVHVVTRPRATRLRGYLVGLLAVGLLAFSLANFEDSVNVAKGYFSNVSKTDNTATRLDIWTLGMAEIDDSIVAGSWFAGEMSVYTELSGAPAYIPLHNDYLQLALGGGMIGVLLFLAWATGAFLIVLRRYRLLVTYGESARARLLRTLLVGYSAWLVTALFNPLLQSLGTAVPLFAIYGMMMVVGSDRGPNPMKLGPLSNQTAWVAAAHDE